MKDLKLDGKSCESLSGASILQRFFGRAREMFYKALKKTMTKRNSTKVKEEENTRYIQLKSDI